MHFNSDIVNAESIVLLIFVLWRCFTCCWVKDCGLGQKVLFRASWNLIFFQMGLNWHNKYDSSWLAVSTGYFYISFLWAIVLSDFPPLEIHKHLVLPLSGITFTAKSQANNHFYKYISLFLLFQVLNSNGLQKKLKMAYMVYFKWSKDKTLYRKKRDFFL